VRWIDGVPLLAAVIASVVAWMMLLDKRKLSRTLETQVAERTLELVTREQWFRSLVQHSSDVVTVVDARGLIKYQSPSVERLFGWDPAGMVGTSLRSLLSAEDLARFDVAMARAMGKPGASFVLEVPFPHRDGTRRDTETVVTNLLDEPDVCGVVLNTRDVTERRQLQERLTQQAYYDALTGLANRSLFQRELASSLPSALGSAISTVSKP
jgi:PAS domain S-box-containing protein